MWYHNTVIQPDCARKVCQGLVLCVCVYVGDGFEGQK